MSYITIDNLNTINAELSNYCNAACPMCNRYDWDLNLLKDKVNNSYTSLDVFKEKIGVKVIKQLRRLYSCGVYGDGATNPECLEIYEFLRRHNPKMRLSLHSNGGTRSKEFWAELAKLGVSVVFAIDGLEDTNHLYRRNVKWENLMTNVNSFLDNKGEAKWQFLLFKHNQHQVEQAKKLSKQMGFSYFDLNYVNRWTDYDPEGNFRDVNEIDLGSYKLEKPVQPEQIFSHGGSVQLDREPDVKTEKDSFMNRKINCQSCYNNNYEIYLMANGYVSPCCFLGDLELHESKNIIDDYDKININHTSLEEILNGKFFRNLESGIAGATDSYRLQTCYSFCGVRQ